MKNQDFIEEVRVAESWDDVVWPKWMPREVIEGIVEFWSCFRRKPVDWVNSQEQYLSRPKFGERVKARKSDNWVEKIVEGGYVHAWNNMARVVCDDGNYYVIADFDVIKEGETQKTTKPNRVCRYYNGGECCLNGSKYIDCGFEDDVSGCAFSNVCGQCGGDKDLKIVAVSGWLLCGECRENLINILKTGKIKEREETT